MENISLFNIYLEKQRKFIALVKEIQYTFNSKEYKEHGYSFKQYIKMKWNISQAQTYRYLMCAKVIDQLKEFEIKPAYESLCKSLYNVTKNSLQMKLLWSVILQKTNNRPDCINSTHVNQYWKEICMDKKYSNICQTKDEENSKTIIEKSIKKLSINKKSKQIKKKTSVLQRKNSKTITTISSSIPINTSNFNIQSAVINKPVIYSNNNTKYITTTSTTTLSPIYNCNNSIPNNKVALCEPPYTQYITYANPITVPTTQTIYVTTSNLTNFSSQSSHIPITTYFQ